MDSAGTDCGRCSKTVKTAPGKMPGHVTMVAGVYYHLGCWWHMTDAERDAAFRKPEQK